MAFLALQHGDHNSWHRYDVKMTSLSTLNLSKLIQCQILRDYSYRHINMRKQMVYVRRTWYRERSVCKISKYSPPPFTNNLIYTSSMCSSISRSHEWNNEI